jgi:hypothetical protein
MPDEADVSKGDDKWSSNKYNKGAAICSGGHRERLAEPRRARERRAVIRVPAERLRADGASVPARTTLRVRVVDDVRDAVAVGWERRVARAEGGGGRPHHGPRVERPPVRGNHWKRGEAVTYGRDRRDVLGSAPLSMPMNARQ